MANKSELMQVCVTCRRSDSTELAAEGQPVEGEKLYTRLSEAVSSDDAMRGRLSVEAVECMNACQQSCTVSLRSAGKYGFILGDLDASEDRVNDVLSFARSYSESEKGLPAWRERPEHIRKNTLVRLHPSPNFSEMKD